MRQYFVNWCKVHWDFEVDPTDERLEYGHLWDWGYYFDEFIQESYDQNSRQYYVSADKDDLGGSWCDWLCSFDEYWNQDKSMEEACKNVLELVLPCFGGIWTNMERDEENHRLISYASLEDIGIRVDMVLNFN